MIDAIQISSAGWLLIAAGVAFLFAAFAFSVFSLQMCMAYFGEEIPSYWGCTGLQLQLIAAVAATLFVGYGFLGPFYFLAAPASIIFALMMISDAAKCDRFFASIIALLHSSLSLITTAFCALVFWIGLSALGFEADGIAAEFRSSGYGESGYGSFTSDGTDESAARRKNVSHSNPFIEVIQTKRER